MKFVNDRNIRFLVLSNVVRRGLFCRPNSFTWKTFELFKPPCPIQTGILLWPSLSMGQSRLQHNMTLSLETYHKLSEESLQQLQTWLEHLLDLTAIREADVEYSMGVLTLRLGQHGTYVFNKQPPNRQLWLSSPASGPKRFEWDESQRDWRDVPSGELLSVLITREIGRIMDTKLPFEFQI